MEEFIDEENVVVKLRRLRLEENKLTSIINKTVNDLLTEGGTLSDNIINSPKLFTNSLNFKESYVDLTRLLGDIKHSINKKEQIMELDMNILKKDVLELENKIKNLKMFINSQLKLKANELHSIEKIESPNIEDDAIKHELKIKVKLFNEIVPSPVRALINSPFKSKEVQEYQEFMKNSRNRCGGWNEFNHNIFVKSWNKHFNGQYIEPNFHEPIWFDNIVNSTEFQDFIREILLKILGANIESILIHSKWYLQYLYYYKRQQEAINSWRNQKTKNNNREGCVFKENHKKDEEKCINIMVKKRQNQNFRWLKNDGPAIITDNLDSRRSSTLSNESLNFDLNDKCEAMHPVKLSTNKKKQESRDDFILRLAKPIKYNILEDENHLYKNMYNVLTIPKLKKPNWRLCLQ